MHPHLDIITRQVHFAQGPPTAQTQLRRQRRRLMSLLGVATVAVVAGLALLLPAAPTAHIPAAVQPYGQRTTYANGDNVIFSSRTHPQ
jgi:hypothetical protein